MKLFIIGPPGSGKGSQADLLTKHYKLKRIGLGDILRLKRGEKSKEGRIIKESMDKGNLVPNEIADGIINRETKNCDNFIVDGFPRDIKQAKGFKGKIDKVIYLTSSDENIIRRLLLRKRADDIIDIIKHRILVYNERTRLVVEYYKKKSLLLEIDGNHSIPEVFEDLKNKLDKIFFGKKSR
ncbi:MAG: nucleoside monophosphate kinase [archaeon]